MRDGERVGYHADEINHIGFPTREEPKVTIWVQGDKHNVKVKLLGKAPSSQTPSCEQFFAAPLHCREPKAITIMRKPDPPDLLQVFRTHQQVVDTVVDSVQIEISENSS